MSRAEEAAMKAYPIMSIDGHNKLCEGSTTPTNYDFYRGIYIKAYMQAEQDIISLIESRIGEILGDAQPAPILRVELRELIKRIEK